MLKQTMKALQDCPGFFGIIDDDSDSDCGIFEFVPNLFHLERYAKENYVLDPVNVFFFLKQVIRNNKGKENQVIKNNKEKKNQVTRNNKGKNEKIEDLINKIEESIMNNIGEGYENYDLQTILEILHNEESNSLEVNNCISICEIIIETFFEKLIEKAIDSIIYSNLTVTNIFGLPLVSLNSVKQTIKNDCNRSVVLKHLYEEFKENVKNFQDVNDELSKSGTKYEIEIFERISENFKRSIKLRNINIDFDKISNHESEYFKHNIIYKSNQISVTKLKSFVDFNLVINKLRKYADFEEFTENNKCQRIREKLKEIRAVTINKREIKYNNLFINFNVKHELQKLYNKVFQDFGIDCEEMIKVLDHFLIPDEIINVFRSLCNNITELNEKTFFSTVYNSNKNWCIMFVMKNDEKFDEKFFKEFVL